MNVECSDKPTDVTVAYCLGAAHQRSSSGRAGVIPAWVSTIRNRDASRVQKPNATPWVNRKGVSSARPTNTRRLGLNRANNTLKGTSSATDAPHDTACSAPICR